MTIDQHVQPSELGVSVNLEDKPKNFIATFETTPLTTHHIYDAARFAVYSPNLYVSERRKTINQAFKDYGNGRLLLGEFENDTVISPYDIVETYVDQEIEVIRKNIELGVDRSTFDIQMATIKLAAENHAKSRRESRERIKDLEAEIRERDANLLLSRALLIEASVSSDVIAAFDKQNGLEELVRQLPPWPTPPPTEVPESPATFESIIEHNGFPTGILKATQTTEPPQIAEAPVVVQQQAA